MTLLPLEKQALLDTVTARLSAVPGVVAVVLGGSYARGTERPDSDLDVAIYYAEQSPFAIDDVRSVAAEISIAGPPDVTGFYGWGPWVNGGAWIRTAVGKVDFIYRNLDQVRRTIDDAVRGITSHDFNQQPAFGFYSVTCLGETHVCVPMHDPFGHIASLKQRVKVYPPALKEKTVTSSLWLAELSIVHAAGYAERGDAYAVSGALTRTRRIETEGDGQHTTEDHTDGEHGISISPHRRISKFRSGAPTATAPARCTLPTHPSDPDLQAVRVGLAQRAMPLMAATAASAWRLSSPRRDERTS